MIVEHRKESAGTFLSSLALSAGSKAPVAKKMMRGLGVGAGLSVAWSPLAYGAAEAAGGSAGAHLIAQGLNFGGSAAEAIAGTLAGHYGRNTSFVQKMLARHEARQAAKAVAPKKSLMALPFLRRSQ